MVMKNLIQAIKKLKIDSKGLSKKFESLEGTRHIIQFEHKDYIFTLSKTFKPAIECIGVTNRCQDGLYIFFADYDRIYKDLMYKNLNTILEKFPNNFENFYIAKTEEEEILKGGKIKGSYHVVNFAKNPKDIIKEALSYCNVDPFFLKIPEKTAHKCHVLRFTEKCWKINGKKFKQKPEFLEMYPKATIKPPIKSSNAHYELFKNEWGIKDARFHDFDELVRIELHEYSTPKVN